MVDHAANSQGSANAGAYASRLGAGWSTLVGAGRITRRWGSLASVDLSGFTRLSERLARHDAAGAEELNATINAQFEPLIEIAAGFGGDVLQFGGDALLIWFEGAHHEQRAAAGAWRMQRSLAAHGRVHTPAGPVRLRMSVGVASGEVTFALIGTTHRELLVLGPTATRAVELESRASAGQILLSDATAQQLPASAVADAGDGAWRQRRDVAAPSGELATADPAGALAFVPPEVRPIVLAEVTTAEHRPITVTFVNIPGTDALAGHDRQHELGALLDRVERAAERAVAEFGVCWSATDIGPDGFKLLFFAGAPLALEDDAGRIIRTALLIAHECRDLHPRIGVNSGLAFAANVGHPHRRTFAIIGDTVNLAARLMGKAAPGRPLVAPATVRASRSWWRTGPEITLMVKGKRHPVAGCEVLGEDDDGGAADVLAPIVGRGHELARLMALLERSGREGASIEVVGAPGLGKTHLVRHLQAAASARRMRTIIAAATSVRSRTPHAALVGALPMLGDDRDDEGLSVDDLVARRDRFHADVVAGLIQAREPTLLVVEDAQWLDEASRSFLGQLLAALHELPWTIVVTRRPDAPPLPTRETLALGPLALDELLEIASPTEGAGWLDVDLDRLARSIDGNPMYFAEALRLPRGSGSMVAGRRTTELLSERLDQVPPGPRRALRALAVVGRPVSLDLLSLAAGQDCRGLAREHRGLLAETADGWWFVHEPMIDTAGAGLARREQRSVHANTAAMFQLRREELGITAAELAIHHFHGGNEEAAWVWCLHAARDARAAGALREAAELLGLAIAVIEAAGNPAEAERVVLELGELDIALGRYEHADALLRNSWARTHSVAPVRALLGRARAAEQSGRFVAARRFLRRAQLDPRCAPGDRVDALLLLALVLHRQGRSAAAIDSCREALIGAKQLGDDRRRAQAHLQLEMVRWAQGHRHASRHESCAEALFRRVGDQRGLGFLLLNRGVNRLNEGPWHLALADCGEAQNVLDRAGYLIDADLAAMNAGVVLVRQGRAQEALARSHHIARTFRGLGWPEGIAYLDLTVAAAHGQRGNLVEALARLERSERVFVGTRNLEFLGETRRQRALCLLYGRRPAEARQALDEIDPAWFELDPVLELGVSWLGGHAALQQRDLDRAGALLHQAFDFADRRRLLYDLARTAWSLEAWAELAASPEGTQWRSRRIEIFRELEVTEALPALPV